MSRWKENEILDLIKSRRSTRTYQEKPIEREKLEVTGKSNKHAQGGPGDRGTRAVW